MIAGGTGNFSTLYEFPTRGGICFDSGNWSNLLLQVGNLTGSGTRIRTARGILDESLKF